jgi:tetratricopeptide (TPR) repeat protein
MKIKFIGDMNWSPKLFIKKVARNLNIDNQESTRKRQSFDYFETGKESYFNKEMNEALLCFDKAFECGFIEYYQNLAAIFYDFRASCLQGLMFHYDAINDYNKSISLLKNDCNTFFSRSISKMAVLDYEGAISDLEKAIELSKLADQQNKEYNNVAREQGFENGASDFYEIRLEMARTDLKFELESKQKTENASSENEKQYRQEIYDKNRLKKLSRIKRR